MAEEGASVRTGSEELVCAPSAEGKEEKEAEKREKIQKLLEDALVASGLENLVIGSPRQDTAEEEEGERGRRLEKEEEFQPKDEEPDKEGRKGPQGGAEGSLTKERQEPHPLKQVPKTEWQDITDHFLETAQMLGPGELVQEANFSLFDAMSAIELMDPKMDASVQWGKFASYPKSMEEIRKRGILKVDGHTPAELIGIMDEALTCMVTWLEGHTLAQTVFTCLYLLDPDPIENLYLRAFSQALVKTVETMRECICRAGVYAEDDQQSVCFGLNMLNSVADSAVMASLKEGEEKAQGLLRQFGQEENSMAHRSPVAGVEVLKALVLRLKFSRHFFALVSLMRKATSQGIEAGVQKLSSCLSVLKEIIQTIDLGTKLDPDDPLSLGFHPVINQRLLPPSYKPYKIIPRADGLRTLLTILSDFQRVFEIGKIDSFRDLVDAVVAFGTAPRNKNVLVRSLIVLLCLQSDRHKLFGSPSIDSLLREDCRLMTNPPSLNPRSPVFTSQRAKTIIDGYFARVLPPMVELLRVYCQHRSRQRQKVPHCLELLGDIQTETEGIDNRLNDLVLKLDPQRQHLACFTTWILYYIMQLMLDYVLLGFEYRLYSPFEMHYVYWYLEYLYGWQHTTLRSAGKLLSSDPIVLGKGKRKAKKKREVPKGRERATAIVHAKRLVCIGMMRALEGMLLDQKIPQPKFQLGYGSLELCYKHRFVPFLAIITPQHLSYIDYLKLAGMSNYRFKVSDLSPYSAAAKHFALAKTALEAVPHLTDELDGLLKAIKTNLVVVNLAMKGHKKDSTLPLTFDFSSHHHFAILRLN